MGKHSHELGRDAPATRLVPGCRFSWGVQDGKGCRYRRGLCVHKNIMIRRRKITECNKQQHIYCNFQNVGFWNFNSELNALIGYLQWVYSNNDNFFYVSFHIGDTPGRVRSQSTVFKLQAIGPLKHGHLNAHAWLTLQKKLVQSVYSHVASIYAILLEQKKAFS